MPPTGESHATRYRILDRRAVHGVLIGVVLLAAAVPALASHDKTDVVTTDDGNTFIGEIKSVQFATLSLDTDAAGLLSIEWRHVTGLTSKFEYRVELSGGIRHFGTLGPAKKSGRLSIVSLSGTIEVDLAEVVAIAPIEAGFWKSLNGSMNWGLTYTQANDSIQYNLSGNVSRRKPKTYAAVSGQSIFNTQEGGESTNQHYGQYIMSRIVKKKWGVFGLGAIQSNPAQGYKVRLIAGGGATNFFIEDSWRLLALNLGIVYNRENVTGAADVDDSAEALVSVAFERYKRSSHSPSVQLSFAAFTQISDNPRFRTGLNLNVSWKVVGDFKFSVQVNNSHDSNPPGTDSNKNDFSLVTSIGYTF
jgi:hypothetical protein